ncbi:MAG: lipopolysaccharide biosynthesis protein RfbH [Nitrospinae bacterium]|nr:lipopolysaccharide biosynthesis protein RfbH [Nitrospinota bacterium]
MPDEASEKEKALRSEILEKVAEYYRAVFGPARDKKFVPGESSVPYGGRVFDEKDMVALAESALDFWLTAGRFADRFERDFARKLGVKHVSLVNSGSSANLLAMKALTSSSLGERRIVEGDEVIAVAAGFPTTVTPIIECGAVPVFVDVTLEDGTYNIDVSRLEEAYSPRTRAVMVAHTLGNPFDLDAVTGFCKRRGLWLVEDNCDALGSLYRGRLTGTFGDLATSSFYPPHHITMGEGGAVYTGNPQLKKIVESLRDWGRDCWCPPGRDNTCGKRFAWSLGTLPEGYDHKYIYRHFGYNLKATDMQAAVGCAQLGKLDSFAAARRRNWKILRDGLAGMEDRFILPNPTPHSDPSWFGFPLTVRDKAGVSRKQIVSRLEARKIQTRMLFAGNLLRHPAFDEMRASGKGFRTVGKLENTDRIMNDTFWIGVYPGLTGPMLDHMIETLRSI